MNDEFAELHREFPGWWIHVELHAGNSRHGYATYHARRRTGGTLTSNSVAGLRAQLVAATEPGRLRHIRGVTGE